jgi:hypothetical protein
VVIPLLYFIAYRNRLAVLAVNHPEGETS